MYVARKIVEKPQSNHDSNQIKHQFLLSQYIPMVLQDIPVYSLNRIRRPCFPLKITCFVCFHPFKTKKAILLTQMKNSELDKYLKKNKQICHRDKPHLFKHRCKNMHDNDKNPLTIKLQ